jgi:hypothetical protein
MKRPMLLAALAAVSITTFAQGPGPGGGPGPGRGPGARGPMMEAPGWSMMTPEERRAHQERMRGFKGSAECEKYMQEHHKLMQDRAQQRGQKLPWDGPRPYCQSLKKPA